MSRNQIQRQSSQNSASCFTYIDYATVAPVQEAVRDTTQLNVWPLRSEKQRLETKRNALVIKCNYISIAYMHALY